MTNLILIVSVIKGGYVPNLLYETELDRITGLTGSFFLAGHYPVDPVNK
jgi:hypothetical protein